MANVSLTDFGPQAKEIERRRRLAELLQEQAGQPIEILSGGGVQAPISPFSVLAKGLQAYNARKQGEGLDEKEAEITKNKASERAAFLAEVLKKGDVVGSEYVPVTAPTQASFDVPGLQPAKAALDLPAGFEQQDVVKPRTQADRTALLLQGAASGRDDISSMIPALMKAITPEEITGSKYGRYERDPMTGEVRQTQAPMATEDQPAGVQEYQFAKQQGYPGSYMEFLRSKAQQIKITSGGGVGSGGGSGPTGKTMNERLMNELLNGDPNSPKYGAAYAFLSKPQTRIDPETGQAVTIKQDLSWARAPMQNGQAAPGTQPSINIGAQVLPPKMTQEQNLAAGFADRMTLAEKEIAGKEGALGSYKNVAASQIPVVGNKLAGGEFQSADQARRNWINAQLRRESGAAIGPTEFQSANQQYFAMPGDTPEVLAQKRRNRDAAEKAMRKVGSPRSMGDAPTRRKFNPATGKIE